MRVRSVPSNSVSCMLDAQRVPTDRFKRGVPAQGESPQRRVLNYSCTRPDRAARPDHGAGLSPCARNTIREATSQARPSRQHAEHAVRRNRTRNAAGTCSGHRQRTRRRSVHRSVVGRVSPTTSGSSRSTRDCAFHTNACTRAREYVEAAEIINNTNRTVENS